MPAIRGESGMDNSQSKPARIGIFSMWAQEFLKESYPNWRISNG